MCLVPRGNRGICANEKRYLLAHRLSGCVFAKLLDRRFESFCQFFDWTPAPIMNEDHPWPVSRHVMVNSNNIQVILAKRLQNGNELSLSSMAKSPATAASCLVPANASQVSSPIRALMTAPCSFITRSRLEVAFAVKRLEHLLLLRRHFLCEELDGRQRDEHQQRCESNFCRSGRSWILPRHRSDSRPHARD